MGMRPFHAVVERGVTVEALARAVADAVSFVAPGGPFEERDEALGVRVFRAEGEERMWAVVLLDDGRLACRIDAKGALDMWFDA